MADLMTLPDLQMRLDRLGPGQALQLTGREVERLFGLNDTARGQLKNFAAGHNCIFAWSPSGVQFLKQAEPNVRPLP